MRDKTKPSLAGFHVAFPGAADLLRRVRAAVQKIANVSGTPAQAEAVGEYRSLLAASASELSDIATALSSLYGYDNDLLLAAGYFGYHVIDGFRHKFDPLKPLSPERPATPEENALWTTYGRLTHVALGPLLRVEKEDERLARMHAIENIDRLIQWASPMEPRTDMSPTVTITLSSLDSRLTSDHLKLLRLVWENAPVPNKNLCDPMGVPARPETLRDRWTRDLASWGYIASCREGGVQGWCLTALANKAVSTLLGP